ncbi:hypothetical protein CDIK_2290, partial [Cucumispora dikerogammari]
SEEIAHAYKTKKNIHSERIVGKKAFRTIEDSDGLINKIKKQKTFNHSSSKTHLFEKNCGVEKKWMKGEESLFCVQETKPDTTLYKTDNYENCRTESLTNQNIGSLYSI